MQIKVFYPEHVYDIPDIRHISEIGRFQSKKIFNNLDQMDANINISSSDEHAISRRERILGINPEEDNTLEERKFMVKINWWSNHIFTMKNLKEKLDLLLGSGSYIVNPDYENKEIQIEISLPKKNMYDMTIKILDNIIPLDYFLQVGIDFNKYEDYETYTNEKLKIKTYGQLREEVIDF